MAPQVLTSDKKIDSSWNYDIIVTFFLIIRHFSFSVIIQPFYVIEGLNFNRIYIIIFCIYETTIIKK